MAVYKRGGVCWYEFIFAGKRIRESAKTLSKTVAKEAEKSHRRMLERSLAGLPAEKREDRIKSANDLVKLYLDHYAINHREKSVAFAKGRLEHVKRLLGGILLPDLTEDAIRSYIKTRLKEKVSGRTINMEVGELSRAIGKPWSLLWPRVRKLEERKDIGKALSFGEETRLLNAIDQIAPNRSQTIGTFVRVALFTGMRSGEILGLTWGQVDFARRIVTVGKAKTTAGAGRQIPMNADLFAILSAHADWFTKRFFGQTQPEHYLFPFGKPTPSDPTKPITDITGAWDALRERSGVKCRLHDLRHTVATKMAEAGVPESTMLALLGHMSRSMLERYSHIRMAAKRDAVEALSIVSKRTQKVENSEMAPTKIPTVGDSAKIHYA